MIMGANDWTEVYQTDAEILQSRQKWVDQNRTVLLLALDQFLATGEWPLRERFRRTLVQNDIDLNLDDVIDEMPKPEWISDLIMPDRVRLSLYVLKDASGRRNIERLPSDSTARLRTLSIN